MIGHPAHVHLFKNLIKYFDSKGYSIKVIARAKECTLDLLKSYNIEYDLLNIRYKSLIGKVYGMVLIDYGLYKICKNFKPDLLLGVLNPYIAHVGKIIKKPTINFVDTECSKRQNRLTFPFTTTICTPSCYRDNLGKKQIKYKGYHELAYLHPNYFKPDTSILKELNVTKKDKFFILRFVSWDAADDIGEIGIKLEIKRRLVKILEKYGKVFITSEGDLPKNLEKYKVLVSPEKIHDLLYYATMYIGDGGTMSSEAAVLGTPVIFVSSTTCGYLEEECNKYGLIYYFNGRGNSQEKALEKVKELLRNPNLKKEAHKKREQILKDKIDVTKWMINFVQDYPNSFERYKRATK